MVEQGRHDAGSSSASQARSLPADMLLVAALIFCAALFGILSRPVGFLAAFWPANAVLLGLMMREPRLASFGGWVAAFAGYVAADLVTGSTLGMTLWLTAANLTEAATGYVLFRALAEDHRRMRWPQSVIVLFAVCCCAAATSAFVGAGVSTVYFGRDFALSLELWFSTELANTTVVLPVILTAPKLSDMRLPGRIELSAQGFRRAAPALALAVSILLGSLLEGPGSFAFPVPALLWCAVSYSLFSTAVLTLCFTIWGMVIITGAFANLPGDADLLDWGKSIRLALALIALAPLSVANLNAARNQLLMRLKDMVEHDEMTGALTRATFIERSERHLEENGTAAVLMLDVDRFKSVNDHHGHAAGDRVLVAFASTVLATLRPGYLFGRLGGEEFAILLPQTTHGEARAFAERLRRAVEDHAVDIADGCRLTITVSIGLAFQTGIARPSLDALLAEADAALYRAKACGRNRVETAAA